MYTICNVIRIFNSAEFYKNLVFHGLGWHIKLTKLGDGNMSGQQNGILKIPSTLWNGLISICQYCHGSFFFFYSLRFLWYTITIKWTIACTLKSFKALKGMVPLKLLLIQWHLFIFNFIILYFHCMSVFVDLIIC